ncbi:hypothetical protein, partial [Glycomyces salinus]|uniref:hypothetical protein n=1 Tax=Glycomyces salinus TaxID=980294 RepID=UPI001E4FFA4F
RAAANPATAPTLKGALMPTVPKLRSSDTGATNRTPTDHLSTLLQDLDLAGIFERIDIAETEITKAVERHPHAADRLWHAFKLLTPTHERMDHEPVYRAHCRELLDRVAEDDDTRPATAAEICCAMFDISKVTPLSSLAMGLYMRAWLKAGLPDIAKIAEDSEHHEALERSRIDQYEHDTRRALAVDTRKLGTIECRGRHHGEPVDCAYTTGHASDTEVRS